MKRQDFPGLGAPLADILPPAFDAELVEDFFSNKERGPVDALGHANARSARLDLSDYAVPLRDAAPDDAPAEVPEIVEEPVEEADGPALPEAAANALNGLERALERASSDLEDLAQPLRAFGRPEEHDEEVHDAGEHDHDAHDHGEQVISFEDAAAKPSWAGGGKDNTTDDGGAPTKKGKGHNKDNTSDGGDTTDGTTANDGTSTDGETTAGDGTSTNDGTTTDSGSSGTDTTETNTGSSDPDVYVSGLDTPDGFNIALIFEGIWTEAQRGFLANAAETISDFVTGDLPNHNGIDDIEITVTKAAIDGGGGAWATGGPRSLRPDSLLPSTGVLTFDEADVSSLDSKGLWEDLGTHEMLHAMGFGTLFNSLGLVDTIDGQKRFTGENAIEAYNREFADIALNDSLSDDGVRLDASGAHWHDGTFTKELLTPYLRYSGNYVSDMTVAALEDLGYDTIYNDTVTIA